jgi:hypothetical protein
MLPEKYKVVAVCIKMITLLITGNAICHKEKPNGNPSCGKSTGSKVPVPVLF